MAYRRYLIIFTSEKKNESFVYCSIIFAHLKNQDPPGLGFISLTNYIYIYMYIRLETKQDHGRFLHYSRTIRTPHRIVLPLYLLYIYI